jgi:hypothetical protein
MKWAARDTVPGIADHRLAMQSKTFWSMRIGPNALLLALDVLAWATGLRLDNPAN